MPSSVIADGERVACLVWMSRCETYLGGKRGDGFHSRLDETGIRGSKPSGSLAASVMSDPHMSWFAKGIRSDAMTRAV